MNWKKNIGQQLLIAANVIFWITVAANFFDGQLSSPPEYFYNYTPEMTEMERQLEFKMVEKILYWKILGNTIHLFLPFLLLIYGNWFILVSNYLSQQRYWGYAWRLFSFLFIIGFILSFHPEFNLGEAYVKIGEQESPLFYIPAIFQIMAIGFWVIFITTPLYLSYNWFQQNALLIDLRNEKLETELSFLKSQINPHFFFNTLNNLYALTLENSKAAPQVILKLSDLMRYTIYDGKESTVLLGKEVAFIENYLELQKIRLHKKSEITFQKNIGNPKLEIPPLLFVIFLENAFKHGVETLRDNAIVDLQLSEKAGVIKFYALNNYDHEERQTSKGLGLENIKRRLKLLFGTAYKLEIVDQENTYRVYLTINLNHHLIDHDSKKQEK